MATNKLLWSSKLIGVFFIMLVCTLSANAQFLRTSYFMEGTHYRQQLNPALTPTKGYFNLPVIGAVNATVGSTSLGAIRISLILLMMAMISTPNRIS